MSIEDLLRTTDISDIKIRQAIAFDWHDGPRQGVCELEFPKCEFVFDLLAERFNPEGLDDRLFSLRELPCGSVRDIQSLLSMLGSPSSRIWIPIWRFATDADRIAADAAIDKVLDASRKTEFVLWTRDIQEFLGLWSMDGTESSGVDDLFKLFGI